MSEVSGASHSALWKHEREMRRVSPVDKLSATRHHRRTTTRLLRWLLFLFMSCCFPTSMSFTPSVDEDLAWSVQDLKQTIAIRRRTASLCRLSSSYSDQSEHSSSSNNKTHSSSLSDDPSSSWKSEWGVQRLSSQSFPFPTTLSALTDQIVTIGLAAVLQQNTDQMNPNVVQNALMGDRVLGRRPVRDRIRDAGRIGIEIDGPVNILHVGLIAAAKASQRNQNIPVTMYFESLEATLLAREMLRRLRESQTCLDGNIEIQALADARLPKRKRDRKQTVNISNGILFVIQPTRNYMTHLQRLAAQATIEGVPLILLSPRMTREITSPWDQSGYQRASAYGGEEPPTGPTPWLMRDFWPPVYSWILAEEIGYSQSILHERQSWDVFACQRTGRALTECDYLASTVNCAGRPTQDLLRKIAKEFTPEPKK